MKLTHEAKVKSADRYAELFEHALAARQMLEHAWDERTAFQGITLLDSDVPSRGQCGVSSLWLARYLTRQGYDAHYTEGIIHIPNDMNNEHAWVEVRNAAETPIVVDPTSDQYQTPWGSSVHVGVYASEGIIGHYTRDHYHDTFSIPHKRLMARFAILEENIARLPRRKQLHVR
jgi:hypothetical protein